MNAGIAVVLISGDEALYYQETADFKRYLLTEVAIPSRRILHMAGTTHENGEIIDRAYDFFRLKQRRETNPHIVMLYNGHGDVDGIHPDGSWLSYEDVTDLFYDLGYHFLFINNCCSSGSAINYFKKRALLPRYGSVLAAANHDENIPDATFLYELQASYRQQKPFRKSTLWLPSPSSPWIQPTAQRHVDEEPAVLLVQHPRRSGLCLDHLLYAKTNL